MKEWNIRKTLLILVGITLSILLLNQPLSSHGQKLEFDLYPSIIEIESEPGQTIQHQIIANGSRGGNYIFKAYTLEVTDNEGHFKSSRKETEYLDWVSFTPAVLNFEAYQEKKVNLTVDIPEDTELGDYYLTISLEREFEDTQMGPVLGGSLEIPLLITVYKEGEPRLEGFIKVFKTVYIDFFNPVTFNVEIENPGLRKLKSFGQIIIKDRINKKMYTKELVPQNVLADSTRIAIDEEGFVQGNDYISWVSPNIVGIYTARVDLYDKYHEEENASILDSSKELTFIYIDFFLFLGLSLGIILLSLVIYLNNKAKNI